MSETRSPLLEHIRDSKIGVSDNRPYYDVVYIGRLVPEKGVHDILSLFLGMPASMNFAFLGNGSEKKRLLDRVKLAKAKNIAFSSFEGLNEALDAFHNTKSVIIMSSIEGCSMVSKEAVALGRKVFSFRFKEIHRFI